jgi:hypothetical protein
MAGQNMNLWKDGCNASINSISIGGGGGAKIISAEEKNFCIVLK